MGDGAAERPGRRRARRRRGSTGGRRWRRRSRSTRSWSIGQPVAGAELLAGCGRRARRASSRMRMTGSCRRAGVCEDRRHGRSRLARTPAGRPSRDQIRAAPKVLLHDHLDGGLRPATVVELAAEIGHDRCPRDDADALGRWFAEAADSGSLVRYLETFEHTVAVMQTAAALARVARECVEDLAADGVVYAEVRYAPEQHVDRRAQPRRGRGGGAGRLRRGQAIGRGAGRRSVVRQLLTAMRHAGAVARDRRARRGAGATAGSSASTSPAPRRASRRPATSTRSSTSSARTPTSPSTPARPSGCRRSGRRSSGAAPTGSATACGSSTTSPSTTTASPTLGRLAAYVRDKRIPLEMCPSSNVQTGAAARSPSTRSACCAGCGSGSRSTPTTG